MRAPRSSSARGVVTCGSGNSTPTALQIELIQTLRPTVIAGMASYALQLAQHAERLGIDLAAGSVKKILTAAEPVSPGKRERLERLWGAELYDQFGITEGSAMASESECHDGMHIWTDQYHVEVVDAETKQPVSEGEMGLLVVTPRLEQHGHPRSSAGRPATMSASWIAARPAGRSGSSR